jgi:hypothetical protein
MAPTGGLQFASTHLRPHGLLEQFGRRQTAVLHQLVEISREVDLHARHAPNIHPMDSPVTMAVETVMPTWRFSFISAGDWE